MIFSRFPREPKPELEVVWTQTDQTAREKAERIEPNDETIRVKHEDRHQRILDTLRYLRGNGVPCAAADDISELTGCTSGEINHSLYTLIARGHVERVLPVDGRRWTAKQLYAIREES